MRKIISIITVALFFLALFAACNGTKTDGNIKKDGNKKNPVVSDKGLTFIYKTDGSPKTVFLAGGFNGWRPDDPKFEMKKISTGTWSITVKLDPGRDEYKFVVDGKLVVDKNAKELEDDPTGGKKSMVTIK